MTKEEHPLYFTWRNLRNRCLNPNYPDYKNYGGRGITVCDEWKNDFWKFVEDVGERPEGHSIDRINNNEGYSPNNCRWATRSEQVLNRRQVRRKGTKGIDQLPNGKYRARVSVKGVKHHIGVYDCPLIAHLAYKDYLTKEQC